MYEQGMSGSSASLEKQAQEYNKRLLNERGGILEEIGSAKVDPKRIQRAFREDVPYTDPLSIQGRNVEKQAAFDEAKKMGKEWFDPLYARDVMGEATTVIPSKRDLLPEEMASKGFSPIEFGKKEIKVDEIPQGNLAQLNDIMSSVNQAIGTGAYKGGAINPASTQELKRQSKSVASFLDGEEGTEPDINLGNGIRFKGSSGNYSDMKVHVDDLEEFIKRVRDYYGS